MGGQGRACSITGITPSHGYTSVADARSPAASCPDVRGWSLCQCYGVMTARIDWSGRRVGTLGALLHLAPWHTRPTHTSREPGKPHIQGNKQRLTEAGGAQGAALQTKMKA